MATRSTISQHIAGALVPALGLCALMYFGFHAVEGRHGLLALRAYEQAIPELEAKAAGLAAERARLNRHVALIGPDQVDPDYLEELVRDRLGFVHPQELIVPVPEMPAR